MSGPKRRKKVLSGLPLPRLRTIGSGGLTRSAPLRFVRLLSGANTPAGREIPSRREAGAGLVLYALLIPFDIWALDSRDFVTGSLLTAIGLVGCAGIALRNLCPGAPRDGQDKGGSP
jgi:hypothetical protein